ncbi:hypothetical protein CBF08_09710 [Salmonella enterica]|nr:hypothetical protein [Salmonella enterica]
MAGGTDMKTGTVPATGSGITGVGTDGTVGVVILRFFPGEFRAQIFRGFCAAKSTKMQHEQCF